MDDELHPFAGAHTPDEPHPFAGARAPDDPHRLTGAHAPDEPHRLTGAHAPDELHALAGAYAVHALPSADIVPYEEHLSACPVCPAEVRRLREGAARLALTAATAPPTTLRPRVLATAHLVRPPRERRRWRAKAVTGLAAVAMAAAAVLGVLAFDARRDLGELRARDAAVAEVLAAPDARTVRQPVTAGGTAVLVVSRDQGRLLVTASGLPELPAAGVYQVWLMGPDGPRPAGRLDRRADGLSTPVLARPRTDDAHVGLTIEPSSGSDLPTTQPILLAELPRA